MSYKSYRDVVQSSQGRQTRVDGAILRGPELLNPGNRGQGGEEVLRGDNVKSLLLANASSGSDKNLCFVNGALNIFRRAKDFRYV